MNAYAIKLRYEHQFGIQHELLLFEHTVEPSCIIDPSVLDEAVQLAPADPAKPPIDNAVEAGLIIETPFDPPLLIRARGID